LLEDDSNSELTARANCVTRELELATANPCGETVIRRDGGLSFDTPTARWSYALRFDLPAWAATPFVLGVSIRAISGRLGVGCVNAAGTASTSGEVFCDADAELATKWILVEDAAARAVIVRNACETSGSRGVLTSIQVRSVDTCSPAELKQLRSQRFGYWHYAFDLGDGVTVPATLPGIMDFHRLNQRILMGLLNANFGTSEAGTVLDAACSAGYHAFALAASGLRVTAIDIDEASIEQARFVQSCLADANAASVAFHHCDLLKFESCEPFDAIWCSGLFYHLRDLVGGACKLYELSKGGAVIQCCVSGMDGAYLEVANADKWPCCFPGEFSFVPTAKALTAILTFAGFRTVRQYPAMQLCATDDLLSLTPTYAALMREHTAYYVALK
jgi:SAM-dependent methyltransferase